MGERNGIVKDLLTATGSDGTKSVIEKLFSARNYPEMAKMFALLPREEALELLESLIKAKYDPIQDAINALKRS